MFTSIPMMSGTLESNALAKNITLKATASGTTSVKLTWNKVKTPNSGYAVFRDSKLVKRFGTKTTTYTDTGLTSATYYTYQIKTYKKTTKTQWYNKKTGKWQSKKPAKKYRGKSRKATTYSYKLKSNAVKVQTKAVYYKITWENWDGTVLDTDTVKAGQVPEYTGNKPTRPADSNYTYTFKGWSPSIAAAKENKTYTAQYTKKENAGMCTIIWKNWDGKVLRTDSVKNGTTPSYGGTPTRPDDSNYTYTFKGWSPTIVAANANATYTAQYTATSKPIGSTTYSITWKNWDGKVLRTDTVEKGKTPSYGSTPTRPADSNYTYTFNGWNPSVVAATANATYTAQYTATANTGTNYKITWKNYDGNVLATTSVKSGTIPTFSGTPTKPSTSTYYYTFTNWNPTVVAATSDATYTATYSTNQYVGTPSNVKYTINSDGNPKITWNSVSGATGYKLYRTYNGSTVVTTVPTNSATDTSVTKGLIYEYYVVALKDSYTSPKSATISVPVPERKTVTSYTGKQRDIYRIPGEDFWRYVSNDAKVTSLASIDRTVDGEFGSESSRMIQYHGATFNATEIANAKPQDYAVSVSMYNGDTNKFTLELENGVYISGMNTYKEVGNHQYNQTVVYYYFKDGHPIAEPYHDGTFVYKTETSGNITTKKFFVYNGATDVGAALGIWAPTFKVYVKYDGKLIETINIDTASTEGHPEWTTQTCNGMSPWRKVALDLADTAIKAKGGSTGNINTDLHLIRDYLEETYAYGQNLDAYGATFCMKCNMGALVLETYAVYRYGKYGFASSGSNYDGIHVAFNLNEDPYTYYEAMNPNRSN